MGITFYDKGIPDIYSMFGGREKSSRKGVANFLILGTKDRPTMLLMQIVTSTWNFSISGGVSETAATVDWHGFLGKLYRDSSGLSNPGVKVNGHCELAPLCKAQKDRVLHHTLGRPFLGCTQSEGDKMKQLKHISVVLCFCILAMVGENTKLAAQDGCPPATCPNGTHSVCHKDCDPNYPTCVPKCSCQCVPDGNASQMNQNKHAAEPVLAQNNCPNSKPLLDELLTTQLWKR